MQYIIFVDDNNISPVMHTAPVADDDAAYLRRIVAELRPRSDDEYTDGPAVLLSTFARHSYVLDDADVYWCVEWDPGLIVVRFSAADELSWATIRSPVPNVGGPVANDHEREEYEEDAADPQYNLVFIPWDAQFDAQLRQWYLFVPADTETHSRFEQAVARANKLAKILEQQSPSEREAWIERGKRNLKNWCGEGIRLT